MTLIVQHPQSGDVKIVKVGFSWTVLFFSFFPVVYRGLHLLHFLVLLIPLVNVIYAFIINKITLKHYIKQGYLPVEGLGWDYAKLTWNLSASNIESIPTNNNIELAAHIRQKTANRWIVVGIILMIFVTIINERSKASRLEQQQASTETTTPTEETAADTELNSETTSSE